MSYPVRLARFAASLALPAMLLAACTSGRQASGEPSGAGSRTATPRFSISYPRCQSGDFKGTVAADTAVGHGRRWTLTLTNVTINTCQMRGWVGLEAFSIVGNAATFGTLTVDRVGTAVDVFIRPNETAYSIITRTSTGDGHCVGHLVLLVSPPGDDDAVSVDLPDGSLCSGHVTLTALAGGTGPGS